MVDVLHRVLVVPDVHVPNHDRGAWEALLAYASTQRYTHLVQLGDFLDLDSLNSHNATRPRRMEGLRLREEILSGKSCLEDLVYSVRRVNPECAAHWLLGNHEDRLSRTEDAIPALSGAVSFVESMDLEHLGVVLHGYSKRKAAFRLGKLHFLHGSYAGDGALKKHLDKLSCSFVMGHTHRLATITKPSQHGTMLAASLGYLGDRDLGESYMDGPEGWQHAFGEAFILTSGDFFLYPIPIVRGRFVAPDGKLYSSAGWDRLGAPTILSNATTQASYRDQTRNKGGRSRVR